MDEQEVERQFVGVNISRIVRREDRYNSTYRVETQDGQWIEFHGGSTSTENTEPWYEVSKREPPDMMDAEEQARALDEVLKELEATIAYHKTRFLDAEREVVHHRDKVAAFEKMIEAVKAIHR